MRRLAWLALLPAAAVFGHAALELPRLGDPDAPASRHVSPRYIERGPDETGARNMVTAVLADYRSFDTLGETVVVLAAGLACLVLLGRSMPRDGEADRAAMKPSFGSPVLDAAIRMLTPFLLLFAAYVAVHGHGSAGGGFQAGAILGAALILIRLVRGAGAGWGLSRRAALMLACAGTLVYVGIGLASLGFGAVAFDFSALPLPAQGGERRAIGSSVIELSVLVTVSSVMTLIFDALSARAEN